MYSFIGATQNKIRSQFKLASCQQPRNVRSMKVEDFYYNETDNQNLTVECAKVVSDVGKLVDDEVKTMFKGPIKKSGKVSKKKSSILAQGPMTGTRKSTRKRLAPSWVGGEPLASSTLTAAALGWITWILDKFFSSFYLL